MDRHALYNASYHSIYGTAPPARVTWETSNADIISAGRGFMGGFDLTMQWQVGCPGGCLYCYLIASRMVVPADIRGSQGEMWGYRVRNKSDVVRKLKKHLKRGALADKTIYWSGVTDPYATSPKLTAAFWRTLLKTPPALRPRRIALQSRFRPDRDVELMQQYSASTVPTEGGPAVLVSYSIGTDRNDLIARWERATPRFAQRLEAIRTLSQAGIYVVATLSPLALWADLPGALTQFKTWGVAYLTCLFFKEGTSSANTPPRFLAYLRQHYPQVLDPAWQTEQVQTMRAIYGPERVLVGKAGFDSLAHPQTVVSLR